MRYFIQIYEDLSITKAAKELYISQQGLSKALKNLESELNIVLFKRTNQGLFPTDKSRLLYERCRSILIEYDEMLEFLHFDQAEKKSSVRIGITNTIDSRLIANTISSFHKAHPDINLEITQLGYLDCAQYIENNWVDLCITTKPDNIRKFNFVRICQTSLKLYMHQNNILSHKKEITLKELQNENFILLSNDTKIRSDLSNVFHKYGYQPNVILSTTQLDLILEYLSSDRAVAILPELSMIKINTAGIRLHTVSIKEISHVIECGVMYHKKKEMIACEGMFINYLIKYFKDFTSEAMK